MKRTRSNRHKQSKGTRRRQSKHSYGGLFKMAAVDDPMQQLVIRTNSKGRMKSYKYKNVTQQNLNKQKQNKKEKNEYFRKIREEAIRESAIYKAKYNREALLQDRKSKLYVLTASSKYPQCAYWLFEKTVIELHNIIQELPERDGYYDLSNKNYSKYEEQFESQNSNMFVLNESIVECMFFMILAAQRHGLIPEHVYIAYRINLENLIGISDYIQKNDKKPDDWNNPTLIEISNILKEKNRLDDLLDGKISLKELQDLIGIILM